MQILAVNQSANSPDVVVFSQIDVVASGTNQGSAFAVDSRCSKIIVSTTPPNSGILLALGMPSTVKIQNNGANPLNIYPPVGQVLVQGIGASGSGPWGPLQSANEPLTLPPGGACVTIENF
jgi:hypothetical protein